MLVFEGADGCDGVQNLPRPAVVMVRPRSVDLRMFSLIFVARPTIS